MSFRNRFKKLKIDSASLTEKDLVPSDLDNGRIVVDTTTADVQINLPALKSSNDGFEFIFENVGTGTITLALKDASYALQNGSTFEITGEQNNARFVYDHENKEFVQVGSFFAEGPTLGKASLTRATGSQEITRAQGLGGYIIFNCSASAGTCFLPEVGSADDGMHLTIKKKGTFALTVRGYTGMTATFDDGTAHLYDTSMSTSQGQNASFNYTYDATGTNWMIS